MYLCIDTISSAAGVTLLDSLFSSHHPIDPQKASESIIETIDAALKKAGADLTNLKGVLIIRGPGSFTGLRVGLSVANQFAHQLKIPIVGLKTDEWWKFRNVDASYIQSMNRAEVYFSDAEGGRIIPIEALDAFKNTKWLGQLKFDHAEKIPSHFSKLKSDSIENTWKKVVKEYSEELESHKIYDLVEPFYGKEPNITKSKKKSILS